MTLNYTMKPRRLIIHFENCGDSPKEVSSALSCIGEALPIYYYWKKVDDRRLTVRFEPAGGMIIYHDWSDAVVFGYKEKEGK